MSKSITCDNCNETLILDRNGEDEAGEVNAWIHLSTVTGAPHVDACTRSCAIALLGDDTTFTEVINDRMAGVAVVVRALRGEDDTDPED